MIHRDLPLYPCEVTSMASFCRMRAVLRSREGCSLTLQRCFSSKTNTYILPKLKGSSNLASYGGCSRYTLPSARHCSTQNPAGSTSAASENDGEPNKQSVEAVVSFDNLNEKTSEHYEPEHKPQKYISRKPKPIWMKKTFLQFFNERLKEGSMNESSVYRFLRSCGFEMAFESEKTRSELLDHVWKTLKDSDVDIALDISHYNARLSVMIENNTEFSPVDFLSELQTEGLQPNRVTFSLLIQAYCNRKDIDAALKLMDFMKEETQFAAPESVYAALIDGYSLAKDDAKALETFSNTLTDGTEPGPYCYAALLAHHARTGNVNEMTQVMSEMREDGIKLDGSGTVKLLEAAILSDNTAVVEKVFESLPGNSRWPVDIRGFVAQVLIKGNYSGVAKLLNLSHLWETDSNFQNDEQIKYMLSATKKPTKDVREAFQILSDNGIHFNVLEDTLEYSLKVGDNATSLSLISEIKESGLPIKTHYFYPIVVAYCRKRNYQGLVDLLVMMKSSGLETDVFITRRISRCYKSGNQEDVASFHSQLREHEIPLEMVSFDDPMDSAFENNGSDSLLEHLETEKIEELGTMANKKRIENYLIENGDINTAVKVYTILSKRGLPNIGDSILYYVNRIGKQESKEAQTAEFVTKLMENGVKEITSRTHTFVLSLLQKARLKTNFFQYISTMKENEFYADEHQYFQMLKMCATVGNSAAAQFCFDKILESNLDRESVYGMLITAYGKDDVGKKADNSKYLDKIIEIYHGATEKGIKIEGQAVSHLLQALLTKSNVEEADVVLKTLGDGSPYLRPFVYNEYLRAYAKRSMVTEAKDLFERLKADENLPKPSRFSYNQLFGALKTAGDYSEISRLIDEMKERGLQADKYSFGELVKAHLAADDIAGAIEVLKRIEDESFQPHLGTYMNIIRKAVHTGATDTVRQAAELVKKHKSGMISDSELDHSLVLSKIKVGDMTAAESEREAANLTLEPKILRRVCRGASHSEDIEYLSNIGEYVRKYNLLSTDIPDMALLNVYINQNSLEGANTLHQTKVDRGDSITTAFKDVYDRFCQKTNESLHIETESTEGEETKIE